jgi:hypothetical protein
MVPVLALVSAILIAAAVIAIVRRWQRGTTTPPTVSASEQLAQFRTLYEQGAISEEEFKRLRSVLGEEIREAVKLLAKSSPSPNEGETQPKEAPPTGIQPADTDIRPA